MKYKINYKYLIIAYLAILLLLSILPLNSFTSRLDNIYILELRLDYFLHILFYLPLAYLLDKAGGFSFKMTVIIVLFLAFLMEGVQLILPYRAFNISDLLANLTGGVLSILIVLLIKRIKFKHRSIIAYQKVKKRNEIKN